MRWWYAGLRERNRKKNGVEAKQAEKRSVGRTGARWFLERKGTRGRSKGQASPGNREHLIANFTIKRI